VASVDEILKSPALPPLQRVSDCGGDRAVREVRVAEHLHELHEAPEGAFVVLARGASAETVDYRLDVALRRAGVRGVAAVAAFCPGPVVPWRPSLTALDIAERAELALLSMPPDTELAGLIEALVREIAGGAEAALRRIELGLAAVSQAETEAGDEPSVVAASARALGVAVELRDPEPGELCIVAPVMVGGSVEGQLCAPLVSDELGMAVRVVLDLTAGAVARLREAARRARDIPIRSRTELLTELLVSTSPHTDDLLNRARLLGLPIDGWHLALRVELENLDEIERDELRRFEVFEAASQLALQAALSTGGMWYLARMGPAILLLRMLRHDPGPQAGKTVVQAGERVLERLRGHFTDLHAACGVGAAHEGPMGLRASAVEARDAVTAARASGRHGTVAAFDAVGLQRMLTQWYAFDTARQSVREQLAPLERLGPKRMETAVRTLKAYLDEQCSIVRTARALHLHRNAVSYRLQRIFELLDVDPSDPDQRLALQLACRARMLG
jgi:sugar diacid utilization regulator